MALLRRPKNISLRLKSIHRHRKHKNITDELDGKGTYCEKGVKGVGRERQGRERGVEGKMKEEEISIGEREISLQCYRMNFMRM